MKRPVVIVMSVSEVNGHQAVYASIGIKDESERGFQYIGSVTCNFEQYGFIHSILKKLPSAIIDYRPKMWQDYIDNILKELASLG